MKNLHKALLIGLTAGLLDSVPMIIQGIDWYASISAFVHWTVLGLIIPFVKWKIAPWLKGLLIGELATLPVMIIVFKSEPLSLIPISMFSAVLGVLVGIAGAKFIKE
jgi:hypothetical protein